ncbi:MAG TPA: GrpB family protein [Natronosporangium sp.]
MIEPSPAHHATSRQGPITVVPAPAKPIIDMLARFTDYEAGSQIVTAMRAIGWVHTRTARPANSHVGVLLPGIAYRTHHLHAVEHDLSAWHTRLAFRDQLRGHPPSPPNTRASTRPCQRGPARPTRLPGRRGRRSSGASSAGSDHEQ